MADLQRAVRLSGRPQSPIQAAAAQLVRLQCQSLLEAVECLRPVDVRAALNRPLIVSPLTPTTEEPTP